MTLKGLEDLKAAPYNPRQISKKAQAGLESSIDKFGDISGIVWNKKSGNLVAGHQRVDALKRMGAQFHKGELLLGKRKFSIRVVDWDENTEKAANVAANNRHIAGDFTDDIVDLLPEIELGIGSDAFSDLALDELAKELRIDQRKEVQEDETPEPPENPVAKLGDVWTLGDHTVECRDNAGLSIKCDALLTDVPYGISQKHGGLREIDYGEWDKGDCLAVALSAIRNVDYMTATVFCHESQFSYILNELEGGTKRPVVWTKPNPTVMNGQSVFLPAVEIAAHARKPKAWFGGNCVRNVWEGTAPADRQHPTQKPISLISWLVGLTCPPDGLTVDPFLGSGTTLVACEQLGRKCYGIEMEPKYVDVIIERWENLTGGKATRKKGS